MGGFQTFSKSLEMLKEAATVVSFWQKILHFSLRACCMMQLLGKILSCSIATFSLLRKFF